MAVYDFGFVLGWVPFLLAFFTAKGLGVQTVRRSSQSYFIVVKVSWKVVIFVVIFHFEDSSRLNCLMYKLGPRVCIWLEFGFMRTRCLSYPNSTEESFESLSSDSFLEYPVCLIIGNYVQKCEYFYVRRS